MSLRLALDDGIIEGAAINGVRRFLSIPYAAPVTPERRFREPQPVEPWTGVRDATRAGPSAPQSHGGFPGLDFAPFIGEPTPPGPDYLTLNVWAPENTDACPVMVFTRRSTSPRSCGIASSIFELTDGQSGSQ